MKYMFIATRAPYGRMHGHKMGIRTYIKALKALGHTVVLVAFDVPGDKVDKEDLGVETRYLRMPPRWKVAWNVATQAFLGTLSINECLYRDSEANTQIQAIAKEFSIDVVIADMSRTALYAENTGLPWFIDHEDLLSERYVLWAQRTTGDENILGYLEEVIPAFARPIARVMFRRLLSWESKRMEKRELYWTERALASSLRSLEETERLRTMASRRVFCMPVTVPIPAEAADRLTERPMLAVFTGGLTYQPNLDGMRAYVERVLPEFERRGIEPPMLHVIGAAPDALRKPLEHPRIKFLGYVPDVNEELRKAQVFFAPIVSGTGIKTKVLEAMACGLPLIALPPGLTGLQGEHGRHYLRATDPADFVTQYLRVLNDPELAGTIGRTGRELAIDAYSIEAATRVLGAEIDLAMSAAPRNRSERPSQLRPVPATA